jgi:hypothetical protein
VVSFDLLVAPARANRKRASALEYHIVVGVLQSY